MSLPLPGLAEQFGRILDGLGRAVAARMATPWPQLPAYRRPLRGRPMVPLFLLLWTRLRRIVARFEALVARAESGRLAQPPLRPVGPPRPAWTGQRLPRGIGWLIPLLPAVAAGYGSQLQHLLSQPEMKILLDAEPQAGRLLRPLCRMLAIPPPARRAPRDKAPAVTVPATSASEGSGVSDRARPPPRADKGRPGPGLP